MARLWLGFILAAAIIAAGCTTAIHVVTSKPIKPDPSETSVGTDLDDWQMATLIGVNIKKASPLLEKSHVNVHTYNRIVLLTGEVPSDAMRKLAGDTARNFLGVRLLHNELQVQGATTLLARTNDSWLSTKVKTKLLANRNIKSRHVNVITENGAIYLMGRVTRAQADTITAVASNTRGARKIVRVFEYIDN